MEWQELDVVFTWNNSNKKLDEIYETIIGNIVDISQSRQKDGKKWGKP